MGAVYEKMNADREIVVLKGVDGARFTMIVRGNGSLAITRNGELLNALHWDAAAVDDCVNALYRLAGRGGHPSK
jgi:hypothetical protein